MEYVFIYCQQFNILEVIEIKLKVKQKVKVTAPLATNPVAITTSYDEFIGEELYIIHIIDEYKVNFPIQLGIHQDDDDFATRGFTNEKGVKPHL